MLRLKAHHSIRRHDRLGEVLGRGELRVLALQIVV
jgi:hypothetical protein